MTTMRYIVGAAEFDTECMVPGDNHSNDTVEVWRGVSTPAIGCGYHAFERSELLYAAHDDLLGGA